MTEGYILLARNSLYRNKEGKKEKKRRGEKREKALLNTCALQFKTTFCTSDSKGYPGISKSSFSPFSFCILGIILCKIIICTSKVGKVFMIKLTFPISLNNGQKTIIGQSFSLIIIQSFLCSSDANIKIKVFHGTWISCFSSWSTENFM